MAIERLEAPYLLRCDDCGAVVSPGRGIITRGRVFDAVVSIGGEPVTILVQGAAGKDVVTCGLCLVRKVPALSRLAEVLAEVQPTPLDGANARSLPPISDGENRA